jgi:hypothetical protein
VLPAAVDREAAVVSVREDFDALMRQVGIARTVDATSLLAVEVTSGRGSQPVPVQFDPVSLDHPQRGELLMLMPGLTKAGETRSFDVYCGPEFARASLAIAPGITDDRLRVSTGPGGVEFEFALDGAAGHPRWTHLSFDPNLGEAGNLLGASGFNGGFGDLTGCTDWITWYDRGRLQETPARADVLHAGPVATTVRVSDLQLWGQGDAVALGKTTEGRAFGAAPAGQADWYFRFYAGKPVVEQWLDYRLESLDHGWTRPLQVRYGLKAWDRGGLALTGTQAVAVANGLAAVPLPGESTVIPAQCMFTPDGNVLQVAFSLPDALGTYFTGRWLVLPERLANPAGLASSMGAAVEQSALEALVDGRVVRRDPDALQLVEFDRTRGAGPGPRATVREVVLEPGNLNPDPSFEGKEAFWALGANDMEARWTATHVYSGATAVDLSCTERSLSLLSTNARASHALAVAPNARYEVTFQARCTAGQGEVHANFYAAEPGCDFRHVISPVPADGEWHLIRVTLTTGDFPAPDTAPGVFTRGLRLAPALRLWTYRKTQRTYVDQVEVRALP